MTVSQIKVKVVRRPVVKVKVLPTFPAIVSASAPLILNKNGLSYTFSLDSNYIADSVTPAVIASVSGVFQPIDSDLTAISALTTTSYGRSLLTQADAAAARTTLGVGSATGISFTQAGTGAVARTVQSKLQETVSIEDFGASPAASASVNTAAIQAAVTSLTAGGILLVPRSGYNINGTITIAKPMTIVGGNYADASGATINATTASDDIFRINSSYVVLEKLYLNRTGASPTGTAISVGTTMSTITDGAITNGSANFSSATANFTAADVGKYINVTGAGVGGGPLFTSIVSRTNSTTVVLNNTASTTVSGATAKYSTVYIEVTIRDVQAVNHGIGISMDCAAQFHVDHVYAYCVTPMKVQNQVSVDYGDSFVSDSTLLSNDSTNGYGVHYLSSGGLKIDHTKILGGKYNFYMQWNVGLSGNLQISNSSLENAGTISIYANLTAAFNTVTINDNFFSSGNPNIQFDNASTSALAGLVITGNMFQGGGGTAIDVGKVNYACIAGNVINNGAVNPAINLRSNSSFSYVGSNNIVGAVTDVTNSGANNTVVTPGILGVATATRIGIGAAASGSFPLLCIGVAQYGFSSSGVGLRYQYGTNVTLLGINNDNNTFNGVALSGTGNDDLVADTSGNISTRLALSVGTTAKLASYAVAGLPTGSAGMMVWCSNCRVFNGAGTQEGAGAGTGGLVTYNGTAWKIAGTNITAIA